MAIDVQHGSIGERTVSKTAILAVLAAVGWVFAAYFLWSSLGDRAARGQLDALAAENQRLRQEASVRQQTAASFAEQEQQAATAQTAFDRLMADRTEVAQQLYDTKADLQLAQQTLARVTGEIDEKQPQLAQIQADSVRFEHDIETAKAELDSLQAEAAKRSQELAEAEQRRDAARQEEAEARRNAAVLARDVEERRVEFAWFEQHGQDARDAYAEAQRRLESVQQQLESAQQQLSEAERMPQSPGAATAGEGTSTPVAAAVAPPPREVGTPVAAAVAPPPSPPREAGTLRDCETCPELVTVAAGGFEMGARNLSAAERPVHRVNIARPFALGRYEVTFAEWDACVADGGCKRFRPDDHGWGRGDRPVIGVSWDDANAYARWLSEKTGQRYRLPTEAEWEYAARGGNRPLKTVAAGAAGTAYWWGDALGHGKANCAGCGSSFDGKQTAPVDSFEPNPLGLYNMHGNAAEWVADCWTASYAGAPTDGAAVDRPQCGERVLRGGAFNQDPTYATAASRFKYDATVRYYAHGFRIARDVR